MSAEWRENLSGSPLGQKMYGIYDTLVSGGELAIELRFVAFVQDLSHVRSWPRAQLQEMATHDERGGGLVFNFQSARTFQQSGSGRKSVKGFWRAARVISPRDVHQAVDASNLSRQSSNRAV